MPLFPVGGYAPHPLNSKISWLTLFLPCPTPQCARTSHRCEDDEIHTASTTSVHHHATNLLKDNPDLLALDVNVLIADLSKVPERFAVAFATRGGHSNHAFFWKILGPGKGGAPKGHWPPR